MNLKQIKVTSCPECGAETCAESYDVSYYSRQIQQHCNGQRWENRTFECGLKLSWIPNFERTETTQPCTKSLVEVKKVEKRKKARESLLSFIDDLDVDDSAKKHMIAYMPHI